MVEKKRSRLGMLVQGAKGIVRTGEDLARAAERRRRGSLAENGGRGGKGMEARTKSAERSAANPGSAKRYRIFAPFCGSGKRAEKNRRSREKIGRRSDRAEKSSRETGGRENGPTDRPTDGRTNGDVRTDRRGEIGGKPRSDGDKNCM